MSSIEYQGNTTMTHLALTPVENPTTASRAGRGVERTLTGIPVTLIWLPYVGFSAILIALMALSFLQYHRKHGHKYHNAKEDMFDSITMDGIPNQEQSQAVSAEKTTRASEPRDKPHLAHHVQQPAPRFEKRSHDVAQKAPPNGGVPSAQSRKQKYYQTGEEDISASEQLIHSSETEYSTTAKQKTGYNTKPTAPRKRAADPNKPHCDEPSTSSSTVSSKNSSNTSKASRSRPHNRRHKAKINFESNQNGSMVDVRIPMEEVETFKPTKPREREKQNRPPSRPTATEQSMGLFRGHPDPSSAENKKHSHTPDITDRIYRGNYVQSRSTSPQSLQQASQSRRGYSFNAHTKAESLAHDETPTDYDRSDRAGSLPIWTTLPLQQKPAPPKRDYYSYPFTPSGHMQMLSDTEDDEVFLLKHTKL